MKLAACLYAGKPGIRIAWKGRGSSRAANLTSA